MKLHLVVVGRNNQQWAAMNIGGIFGQLGADASVRTTWIDDASDDMTTDLVRPLAGLMNMGADFKLIANPVRCGGLSNILVAAMKDSDPDEIVITWDADDFFASPHVFQRIAQEYRDPECWMTYGGYRTFPAFERGLPEGGYGRIAGTVAASGLRNSPWHCEPPRSFYAGMLKHVPPAYLSDPEGRLYDVAWDFALYMALMERAGTHLRYIPDVLYLYNETNPLSDFRTRREMLLSTGNQVRSMIPLEPLPDRTW